MAYSNQSSGLRPTKLDDATLLGIGRLIRAFTELEDLVTLYLCQVAEISEAHSLILLGKTGITKKIQLISQFTKDRLPDHDLAYKEALANENFNDLLAARNVAAHGLLIGITDTGRLAFQSTSHQGTDGDTLGVTVDTYEPGDFSTMADIAEDVISQIEARLGLQSARESQFMRPLKPHKKANYKADNR